MNRKTYKNRNRIRKTRRGGVRNNLSSEEKKDLRAVLMYERNPLKFKRLSGNTFTIGERITHLLEKQLPLTEPMIVYRGQIKSYEGQSKSYIFPKFGWFSTSLRKDVATSYSYGQYLFKIHVQPGVKVLNMYNFYKDHGIADPVKELAELQENYFQYNKEFTHNCRLNDYTQFQEVLVQGNGSFWQDPEKKKEGFKFAEYVNPVSALLEEQNMEGDTYCMVEMYETYYFP